MTISYIFLLSLTMLFPSDRCYHTKHHPLHHLCCIWHKLIMNNYVNSCSVFIPLWEYKFQKGSLKHRVLSKHSINIRCIDEWIVYKRKCIPILFLNKYKRLSLQMEDSLSNNIMVRVAKNDVTLKDRKLNKSSDMMELWLDQKVRQ